MLSDWWEKLITIWACLRNPNNIMTAVFDVMVVLLILTFIACLVL